MPPFVLPGPSLPFAATIPGVFGCVTAAICGNSAAIIDRTEIKPVLTRVDKAAIHAAIYGGVPD
eukprot:3933575-Rhodomonas_salina.3